MRSWLILLGGLLLWAIHFFALYAVGEFGDGGRTARTAIVLLTLALLAADLVLLLWIGRRRGSGFSAWRDHLGGLGALLAALAILWQGMAILLLPGG